MQRTGGETAGTPGSRRAVRVVRALGTRPSKGRLERVHPWVITELGLQLYSFHPVKLPNRPPRRSRAGGPALPGAARR